MKKISVLLLTLLIGFSCKKNEVVVEKTTLEKLTGTTSTQWKLLDGAILSEDGASAIPLIGFRPPCETDNILTLYANKTCDFTEGATKCNATDPDALLRGIAWKYDDATKVMSIDKVALFGQVLENAQFTLSEVTETTFSGLTSVIEYRGQRAKLRVKFGIQK